MPLGNDGFFSMNELLNAENTSLFTNIDTKTILGKNLVLNFLGKIEFEIKALGFSDTANEIAEYYEFAKKQGGIVEFFSNPVIKMILQEMQDRNILKKYLKQRIFDDIEQEEIECFKNTYKNNEKLTEEIEKDKQEFLKQKRIKDKTIKEIMKENNISYEQAEKIYNKKSISINEFDKKMEEMFKGFLGEDFINTTPLDFLDTKSLDDFKKEEQKRSKKNNKKIKFDDSKQDENADSDNFWS